MSETRDRRVSTYLTEAESERVRTYATRRRISISTAIGQLVLDALPPTDSPRHALHARALTPEELNADPPEWPDEFGRGAHYDATGAKS
jgi:hypothetical protein